MTNITIVGNRAATGAAGLVANTGTTAVRNSVIWANQSGLPPKAGEVGNEQRDPAAILAAQLSGGEGLTVVYSCVEGWPASQDDDGNLLDCNSGLRMPAGADGMIGTADDDLRAAPDSVVVDGGSNVFLPSDRFDLDADGDTSEPLPLDLSGRARITDHPFKLNREQTDIGLVDMGAFEVMVVETVWVIGEAVEPPAEALNNFGLPYGPPDVEPVEAQQSFEWDPVTRKFYAVKPLRYGLATLRWPVTETRRPVDQDNPNDPEDPANKRIPQLGSLDWPKASQRHIGGAPVDLTTATDMAFVNVVYPFSDIVSARGVFNAGETVGYGRRDRWICSLAFSPRTERHTYRATAGVSRGAHTVPGARARGDE